MKYLVQKFATHNKHTRFVVIILTQKFQTVFVLFTQSSNKKLWMF